MTTWRYTATYVTLLEDTGGRRQEAAKRRPYTYLLSSEEEGLEKLDGFFQTRKEEFGERLLGVALERTESDVGYQDEADWEEVKRLTP